jgi:alkane 1-monooxygenase
MIANIFLIYYNKTYYQLIYVFLIIPLIELLIPFPQKYLKPIQKTKINDLLLYGWYPFEILLLCLHIYYKRLSIIDSIVMGLIFGLGINVAHELIHKNFKIDKFFGRRLLELTFYGIWEWQHLLGHHKNVGKLIDPATAPLNMSVYEFIPKSIYGTIIQSYKISNIKFYNSLFKSFLILYILLLTNTFYFYIRSCMIGIIFLEIINYIEHYGLSRNNDETVQEQHSWDAPFVFSSFLLFKLPLHSDHHLNSWKSYSELEIKKNSPKLPYSYPIMIIISLFPPLFFKIIHKSLITIQ